MFKRVIIYLFIFIAFLVSFSFWGFWQGTHPQKFITKLSPNDLGWKFEEVSLTTKDGITLSAWFVPSEVSSERVIILLHGYPADKASLLSLSQFLHHDFNLLFVDFRYFGNSGGSTTTLGDREQEDAQAALDYLSKKGFTKVGVMGFSFGGAVALLTAAKDERIKAVTADSPFTHIDFMGHVFYQNFSVFKYPLTSLTKLWARVFGINPDNIIPEKAATKLTIPILVIHSRQDQLITFENAKRLKQALEQDSKTEFLFFEEGTHGVLPDHLQEEYQTKVLKFFQKNLCSPSRSEP